MANHAGSTHSGTETILNVDDNVPMRHLRSRQLEHAGYRVVEAGSGDEALRLVATEHPQLIVLDVNLPDIDGFEICRRIKRDPATAHIMVAHLSATRGATEDRVEGLEGGADAYLAEPVEPAELRATVRALLRLAARETDNRRLIHRLTRVERQFEEATEAAHCGVWDWDIVSGGMQWFGAHERLAGLPPGGFSGHVDAFTAVLHPDDRDGVWRHMEESMAWKAEDFSQEYRFLRPDGSVRWIRGTGRFFYDDRGRPIRMTGVAQDITERKQAEEALRESERQLRVSLDASNAGVWSWDAATNKALWDDRYHEMYGFAPGQARSFDLWIARVHPDDRRGLEARIRELLAPGADTVWDQQFRIVHPQTGERWMQGVGRVERDQEGRAVRFSGLNLDITDRKRAEQRLGEQERKFRNIFETVPVSIWEEDWAEVIAGIGELRAQGVMDFRRYFADHRELVTQMLRQVKVLDVNAQTCAMFDAATKQELLFSLETVFSTEDTLPGFESELVALAEGCRIFETEMALRTVRGRLIHIFLTMTFPGESHPREPVLVSVIDITQRRRAAETRNRLAAIVESTDDAIIGETLDGVVSSWNSGAARLYGYTAEEMIGESIARLIPEAHRDDEATITATIMRGQRVEQFETVRQAKDGRLIDVSLTISPVRDESGTIVGNSKIARDITERKRTEQELARRGRLLEAANKELEAFSYSVSHDLQAPLRSIDGFSRALLEDCAGKLNDQEKDHLNRIRAASQRMGQLIDDLLGLSRATRTELRCEPVDLSALALSSAERVRQLWPDRQVELVVAPDLRAQGDPRLLRIVFDNLLGNAWKFTSKRAQATIEVGARPHEGATAFFVRDNGAGFDMAYAGKLFGAFQRLHAMTEFPGTGIGLATVQRIVARHGGRVWAESKVGAGATFYFTIEE